jgi:hypothetical protein
MSRLPPPHWQDRAWRQTLAEQEADQLRRLRLLLARRIAWLRHRTGRGRLTDEGTVVTDSQVDEALQDPDDVGEARFQRDDPEGAGLTGALDALDGQLAERAQAMRAAGTPFPDDELSSMFQLGPAERDVLALALAPELDPAFERLYAYAQDDATRRYLTPSLATDLLGPAVRHAVQPDGPLVRRALLRDTLNGHRGPASVRPLCLEARVVWYLQGVDHPDVVDGMHLRPVHPVPVSAEAERAAAAAITALGSGPPSQRPPQVNLVGPSAGQAAALAATIAAGLGLRLHTAAFDDAPGWRVVAWMDREAALRRTAYFVDATDGASPPGMAEAGELVESVDAVVLMASRHPDRVACPVLTLTVPATDPAARLRLWEQALPDLAGDETLDALAYQFPLEPHDLATAAVSARGAAHLRGGAVTAADAWQACRRQGRRGLGGLVHRVEPRVGWDDIVVPADVRSQLGEIVAQVRHRAVVYERWGFGVRLTRGRGVTALFAGPSGTGKTMAAEVLAAELGLDLLRVDLSAVVDKYIGETEKNLRRVFDAAEQSGAVLFFDEADALFGKRTEVRDSHDRYANIEIDYLLQRMEQHAGLAILATNRKAVLDRAFLRRLRFLVDFPFPAADGRLRIWRRALPAAAPQQGVDLGALASMELAGGNIQSIALNAAFLAAADGGVITMDLLSRAAAREYAKLDQAPNGLGGAGPTRRAEA